MVSPIENDSAITGSALQYLTFPYNYANSSGAELKIKYKDKFFSYDTKIYNSLSASQEKTSSSSE